MPVRSEAFWTPVLRSDLHRLSFLLLLVSLLGWLSGSASAKAQTCQPNQPTFNVTLRAGSASGTFWKLGRVKDVDHCGQLCCQHHKCDLAFSVDDYCYNVKCHSEEMCRLRRENFSRHQVAVTMVTRMTKRQKGHHLDTIASQAQGSLNKVSIKIPTAFKQKGNSHNNKDKNTGSKEHKNKYESDLLNSYQSKDRGIGFEIQESFPTKAVLRLESKLSHSNTHLQTTKPGTCRARRILRKVTLRSGLKSGDFADYGQVPDMEACVKHCCTQETCDLSLLLNNHCYTLHCYKPELCKIMPAHSSKLEPQLAFVTRSAEDQSNTRVKKKTSSSDRGLCPHGAIFSDVSLKGGQKAGEFHILGGAKDMRSCIQKCCASPSCQVAWLLGDHCYSVACYDKCITVKKSSSSIRSQLTLLTRKPQQIGNDKRQDIPGGKGKTEKVFTMFLTITDKVFTDNLKDIESLEFLNLAVKLQVAVSSVFASDPSYKPEVISFQPSPIIAKLKMTANAEKTASQVLKPLLDAVKTGQLKSSIDGTPISFKVSEASFRFLTSSGLTLVCDAEHDYDINWKLAMFNSTANQICPRQAQGQAKRICAGSETVNATWLDPDFSGCVSPEYNKLHRESKDLADRAEKKLAYAKATTREVIEKLEKLVYRDTYRDELSNGAIADKHANIRASKKNKGTKSSKQHDKPTFVKKTEKNDQKEDPNSVPVTEIPRARPEILPTSPTVKDEGHNPVWFSDSKIRPAASNRKDNLRSKNINHPTTAGHFLPTTSRTPLLGSMTSTDSSIPVQDNSNSITNRNRVPTQAPSLQRESVGGSTGTQNSVPRSRVQNTVLSNTAMAGQRQNAGALNGALHLLRNPFQKAQIYQHPNPQLVPGYARPPNPYQWPGSPAWQGNRAGFQSSWGRGYAPPGYSSEQLDIGRRKRDVPDNNERERRQNTLWYNTRQYPSQYNYPGNRGIIPSATYQQPEKYYPQNAYRSFSNQAAANTYQTGYQRPPYGQSLGTRLPPAGQRSESAVAPGLKSQIQTNTGYRTQPGILSGARAAPVERWPTLVNPIPKPTLALHSQNTGKPVLPSTKSKVEMNTNQQSNQNTVVGPKVTPAGQAKPTDKITNKLSPVHEAPKQSGIPVQRTSESKKAGSQNNLSKKLQDISAPVTHAKTQVNARKRQNITVTSIKRNEKHVAPMFGGDILLSVGVLKLLQKFTRLSGTEVTETELKLFVNSSSHLLDVKNKQEWKNAQKHAEALYKKGINVLEDSNNWDWDESQGMTSQDSAIEPVVLDLVRTVQEYAMNASYSVSVTKPLLAKNILLGVQTFSPDSSDPTRPMSFPNYSDPVVANWSTGHDSITLTPSIFDSAVLGKSVNVHLLTSRFKTISQLLPTGNDSGVVLNSALLSSTVRPAVTDELVPPVKIVFSLLNSSLINFDQQCVAWTSKESQGGKSGEWSSKGCKLTESNATHTTCECNHMTDFAILADTNKAKGTGAPHPSAAVPSPGGSQDRTWIGILLAILAVLVVIIVAIVLLFYWRRRRRSQDQGATPRQRSRGTGLRRSRSLSRSTARASRSSSSKSDGAASPASSHSSQFDEMIAARRRRMAQDKQEKARRAQEEGDKDEDDDNLLMKEKAMLFSDYHQPYHFLSKEDEARAAANRRELPGSSRPSPPRQSRRSAMDQEGSDV